MQSTNEQGTITAYPLSWPVGWQRMRAQQRARYGDRSLDSARRSVTNEVRLFGGQELIISSNIELRLDGLPRSGQRQPLDRGVAIYFRYKGRPVSFACDQWSTVEDNLWAINLTLSALRAIKRAGASELLDRAFSGFDALPAPKEAEPWWRVLNLYPHATIDEIRTAYRGLVKVNHPDAGGSDVEFKRIQEAYETAQQARS